MHYSEEISESLRKAQRHLLAARGNAERWSQGSWTGRAQMEELSRQLLALDGWIREQRELCADIGYHAGRDEEPDYMASALIVRPVREPKAADEMSVADR